jgi:hypothetical protein
MEAQNTLLILGFFSFYDGCCERLWSYNHFIIQLVAVYFIFGGKSKCEIKLNK